LQQGLIDKPIIFIAITTDQINSIDVIWISFNLYIDVYIVQGLKGQIMTVQASKNLKNIGHNFFVFKSEPYATT
jgi:hypothetical protein